MDQCLKLVRDFIQYQQEWLERQYADARKREPDIDIHGEIISDLANYGWCNSQVLWQLALWRCQGIFEAMMKNTFLKEPKKFYSGLVAKLDAMRAAGFQYSNEEYVELRNWGDLHNAISHAPPEQYRSVEIRESDLIEYVTLLKRLCARWREGL
ncbi:hypothetical protein [Pseudodesulfovibrio indicus]|uniref:hypothetical protein n=1 Tax=Pseudodesulfovibrio indicus TaxID=1716143 RepID=UPI00292EFC1A|nr:hypothetical protein [Pseudodesulfovibrio indicus]